MATPTIPPTTATVEAVERVTLEITGMTCAACAARIERTLNKLDGVDATVNYAIERAAVRFDPSKLLAGDLVDAVESIGYGAQLPATPAQLATAESRDAAADGDLRGLRDRLIVSASLGLPVLALSMIPALQFRYWQWVAFVLTIPVALWGGWPFHRAALLSARHRTSTMDTLVSIGVLASFGWSVWALVFGNAGRAGMSMTMTIGGSESGGAAADHLYLEVASAVVIFLLTGRYLEARAKRRSGAALAALAELGAKEVAVLGDDCIERLAPIGALGVGDRFVVRPGEKIATDGIVVEGESAVDASLVTGESVPVDVAVGDTVIGASLNTNGRLIVRATKVGADTALAHITRLVEDAQSGKAPIQRLADRVSAVFVPIVLLIAVGTLIVWLVTGHRTVEAFTAAIAVLVVACPCALGLATPTALLVGTGRGAQLGILIRGPEVLESTRRVDTIVLDKTGTVTTGTMRVVDVIVDDANNDDTHRATALRFAGALEAASEHPIARAITTAATAAREQAGALPPVEHFAASAGLGVEGTVGGHAVVVGRPSLLASRGLAMSGTLTSLMARAEERGSTVVAVGWDGAVQALIAVADTVKLTSATAIDRLRAIGLRPILLTGDNASAARAVATAIGIGIGADIADVIAGVAPAGKVDVVRRLQAEGKVVAMVGDGVNDAAALAQADLGIAIGTGTDVAIEAADLTLVSGDLGRTADAIALSRRTLAIIKGNLFWAFAYNVAALPLAATGRLNPVIAGLAMAGSSLFVVTNSLRLRCFRPVA